MSLSGEWERMTEGGEMRVNIRAWLGPTALQDVCLIPCSSKKLFA